MTKDYLTKDGRATFRFVFAPEGSHIAIWCLSHPSLEGRDPNPHKTHLYDSGRICFIEGREPRSERRAEALAQQWAEYFWSYVNGGPVRS